MSSSTETSVKRGVKRKRETFRAALEPASTSDSNSEESGIDSDSEDNTLKSNGLAEESASVSEDSDDSPQKHNDKSDPHLNVDKIEVKVLSHAEKRRLKKQDVKTVEAKKSAEKPGKDAKEAASALPKRQNSIWVGNLAFKTTEKCLREFFKRGAPECEITRINMPTKTGSDGMRGGENRGFAYVDFSTKEAQQAAISLSEKNLDGRKLLIKDGDDFKGRPTSAAGDKAGVPAAQSLPAGKSRLAQKILATQKQPPAPTLFFGNLGFQTTEKSIKNMLEGHREVRGKEKDSTETKRWIRKIRIGTFEDTGNCKGWAFVDFYNIEDATAVLIDPHNHHLDGRKLVVEYASPDAVRRGGGPRVHESKDTQQKPNGKTEKEDPEEEETAPPRAKKPKIIGEGDTRKKGGKARRAKPGAALALAQREKVAIVPSTGKKIKF